MSSNNLDKKQRIMNYIISNLKIKWKQITMVWIYLFLLGLFVSPHSVIYLLSSTFAATILIAITVIVCKKNGVKL